MRGKGRIFSGYEALPDGMAADIVTEGCMVLEDGAFRGLYGEAGAEAYMHGGAAMQHAGLL